MKRPHRESEATALTVANLSKSYGARHLWTGVQLLVEPGQMVALTGASGSGKTTLLNCIGALERPTTGSITWRGLDVAQAGGRARQRMRRSDLGYLFQNYALVESASIAQNIDYAVRGPWPWLKQRAYSDELSVVGLKGRHMERVYQLSGGEQQRVALARIIAKRPSLILADEPTGALDDVNGHMVVNALRRLASEGAIVIIATHNPDVSSECHKVLHLDPAPTLPQIPL